MWTKVKNSKLSKYIKRSTVAQRVSFVIAIGLPLIIFSSVGMQKIIKFDGAMNLQVAQNLVEHGAYSRFYELNPPGIVAPSEWERQHPQEVQTNGPYIFVAALAIAVFGDNQLGYQAANLIFIVALSALIWLITSRRPILATFAPLLTLLALPTVFDDGLGGMGEIPALFFAIGGLYILARACRSTATKHSSLRTIILAMLFFGLSIITKTYMIGFAPAYFAGLIYIYFSKNPKLPIGHMALAATAALVPVLLFEIYKLINLGSLSSYKAWWDIQLGRVAYQSGTTNDTTSSSTFNDLFHGTIAGIKAYAGHINIDPKVFVLTLFILVILATYISWHLFKKHKLTQYFTHVELSFILILGIGSAIYLAWWFFLLPPEKYSFTRRIYPSILPLLLLLLVALQGLTPQLKVKHWKQHSKYLLLPTILLVSILGLIALPNVVRNVKVGTSIDPTIMTDYQKASEFMHTDTKSTFYGTVWWSSPVVSLMSNRELHSLSYTDVCTSFQKGHHVLVWDGTAASGTGQKVPNPDEQSLSIELYRDFGRIALYTLKLENCNQRKT